MLDWRLFFNYMLLNEKRNAGCSGKKLSHRSLIYLADSSTAASFKRFIRAAQQVHLSGVFELHFRFIMRCTQAAQRNDQSVLSLVDEVF